ncbi:MAG: hypothetical protein ABH827_03150 [bacterium]
MAIMVKDPSLRKLRTIGFFVFFGTILFGFFVNLYGMQKENSLVSLEMAIENNRLDAVREFLKDPVVRKDFIAYKKGECAANAVYRAARYNRLELFRVLLQDVGIKDAFEYRKGGYFANWSLNVAANNGSKEVVQCLVGIIIYSKEQLEAACKIAVVKAGSAIDAAKKKRFNDIVFILKDAIDWIDKHVTNNVYSIIALLKRKKSVNKLVKLLGAVNSKYKKT